MLPSVLQLPASTALFLQDPAFIKAKLFRVPRAPPVQAVNCRKAAATSPSARLQPPATLWGARTSPYEGTPLQAVLQDKGSRTLGNLCRTKQPQRANAKGNKLQLNMRVTWMRYCSLMNARSKATLCPTTTLSGQSCLPAQPAPAGLSRGMRSARVRWLDQE